MANAIYNWISLQKLHLSVRLTTGCSVGDMTLVLRSVRAGVAVGVQLQSMKCRGATTKQGKP